MEKVNHNVKPIDILLVEDNPGDARLAEEALKSSEFNDKLFIVRDGEEALNFLYKKGKYTDVPVPDLILLDLNLPKIDGREVLAVIKNDEKLKSIPVIVLTISKAEQDIIKTYSLHANCYIVKPLDLDQFIYVIRSILDFWLTIVRLPSNNNK